MRSIEPILLAHAESLGLTMITKRLPLRAALFEHDGKLPPARAAEALSVEDGLSTLARLGPLSSIATRMLALLETRPGERAMIARDLLERGFFGGETLRALQDAARSASPNSPGQSADHYLRSQFGALTLYGSEADLERLVEQGSLGGVVELRAMQPQFDEFLGTPEGQTYLRSNVELYNLARLPSLAFWFARLWHERSPTLAALSVLCEVALDAELPKLIEESWFEPFGEEAKDLRTYVRLRAAMHGDNERFKSGHSPGHRSAIPLIDLGIAPGNADQHVKKVRDTLAHEPRWRYARSVLVEAESRRAEGSSHVPFLELMEYVDRVGNDFWTWQKAFAVGTAVEWKKPALQLLGRELEASPGHADLWRVLLSALCPEDEYRAGLAIIAARLAEQQRI